MDGPTLTAHQLMFLYRAIYGVSVERAQEFLQELRLLETTMPITDPTRWVRDRHIIEGEIKVAEKFLALRQEIEACAQVLEERR